MKAHAIVFDAPRQLSVKQLDVREPGADDLVVEVAYSGISTGTERLLWSGTCQHSLAWHTPWSQVMKRWA